MLLLLQVYNWRALHHDCHSALLQELKNALGLLRMANNASNREVKKAGIKMHVLITAFTTGLGRLPLKMQGPEGLGAMQK